MTDIPTANYWCCGQVKRSVSAALRAHVQCRRHTDKAVETTFKEVFDIPFTALLAISLKAYLKPAPLKSNDLHSSLHMWLNVRKKKGMGKKQAPFAVMSKVVNFGSCWDNEVECEMPSSSQDTRCGYIRADKIPPLLSGFLFSILHGFSWSSLHGGRRADGATLPPTGLSEIATSRRHT